MGKSPGQLKLAIAVRKLYKQAFPKHHTKYYRKGKDTGMDNSSYIVADKTCSIQNLRLEIDAIIKKFIYLDTTIK